MPAMATIIAAAAAVVAVFFVSVAGGNAAAVEHTFVVSQVSMNHLCKDTLVTVVNGQLPGPAIEVAEGDSLAVHVVNNSPYGLTIHWHGVKQRLNCRADGAGMITQCPIQPGQNFTYRFNVAGQEGTLWWHAHVASLRATVHGALVIRPRSDATASSLYPFPRPHKEIPIIIGEWWEMDLVELDRRMVDGFFDDNPSAAMINGKPGDLYNCSGAPEENYILEVEQGKTYLLRVANAVLFSEYYLKIAGHNFTVVAADANFVKPYNTDILAIAPGQTLDVLMVANAPPGRYYMAVLANQPPQPDPQIPMFVSRGVVQYNNYYNMSDGEEEDPSNAHPLVMAPNMPDQHDTITSFYFHRNLTSLRWLPLPVDVDEHLFIVLSLGSISRPGVHGSCDRSEGNGSFLVATMNNVSFELPTTTSLLQAHYHSNMSNAGTVQKLPDRPRAYNFTDQAMIPPGLEAAQLEPTSKAIVAKRFRHNATVEIVFQSTALRQSDSNPMHLHGHDFFILSHGLGNYDAARDAKRYNLVNPPVRNTVLVPRLGWVVIRFVVDNLGMWYLHCHYGFHTSMGMAVAFEVDYGPTLDSTLPPAPADLPRCEQHDRKVAYE